MLCLQNGVLSDRRGGFKSSDTEMALWPSEISDLHSCYPSALLPLVQRQEWWRVFYHSTWVLWGGNGVL